MEENDRANAEASDKKTAETERGVNEGESVATRQADSRGSFCLQSHQIDAPPLKLLNDQAEPRNNGNVECRSSFSKESASVIINISKRNWKTVANTIFKHEEIKAELLGPITKAVDAEFSENTGGSGEKVRRKNYFIMHSEQIYKTAK